MTLSELLVALSENESLFITLKTPGETGGELITFNAPGYASVESDLGALEVDKITILSLNKIEVLLAGD